MARFTAGLLKTSMSTLYRHEKDLLKQYLEMMDNGNITQQIIDLPGENLVSHEERHILTHVVASESNNSRVNAMAN